MTTHQVPTIGPTSHPRVPHPGTVAALAALALLLAASALLSRATRDEESVTPAPEAVPTAPAPATPVRAPTDALTVYLVGTPAQAELAQRGISEAEAIRAELRNTGVAGETNSESMVLLVASAEGETALRWLVEQDAIRAELGLPPIRFVDLRTVAAATPPRDAPAVSDAEMYLRWQQAQATPVPTDGPTLVYLVSTDAGAAALRASAPEALVLVWGTAQAEDTLRAVVDQAPPGVRIVDQRFATGTGQTATPCAGDGAGDPAQPRLTCR
jgi:hypothetical protein